MADVVEVTGGFLGKPEGKNYGFVGPELNIPGHFGTGAGIAPAQGRDGTEGVSSTRHQGHPRQRHLQKANDKYFKIDVYGK